MGRARGHEADGPPSLSGRAGRWGTAFAAFGGVHHTSREVSAGTEAFRGPGGESHDRRAGLLEPAFRPLPLGSIRPRGWLARQIRIQADGLSGHLDEFWPDVGESQWFGGEAARVNRENGRTRRPKNEYRAFVPGWRFPILPAFPSVVPAPPQASR